MGMFGEGAYESLYERKVSYPSQFGSSRSVALTEWSLGIIQNLLVEQDNTRTQSDPDTVPELINIADQS